MDVQGLSVEMLRFWGEPGGLAGKDAVSLIIEEREVITQNPTLLIIAGDIISCLDASVSNDLSAIFFYDLAIEKNPRSFEAAESIAFYKFTNDYESQEVSVSISRALELGASLDLYVLDAKFRAEQGDKEGALNLLKEAKDLFFSNRTVDTVESEIREGFWDPIKS